MNELGIGIIGCGNISAAYMRLGPLFKGIKMVACADISMDAAKARASEFCLRADSIDDLLAADDIDIIVNLTIPAAHVEVSSSALKAGKHVYSEKPFVLSKEEGDQLKALADEKGLRVGSAPDTFLGGAHQLARYIVDEGLIGNISTGTCAVMNHGMEDWHPNPDFFFQPGAGPILDLGPYYISNLVQLLGPVSYVTAMTTTPRNEREILNGPRMGQKVPVRTPTSVHALLSFESGALINLISSWDVWHHAHNHMELYGADGTLYLPDPNFFGGELKLTRRNEMIDLPAWDHPFSIGNEKDHEDKPIANYRTAGLADMAISILEDRPHRCSLDFAHHVVDIMTAILASGEQKKSVDMTTRCARPEALPADAAAALLR